jgi:hypothetical protein
MALVDPNIAMSYRGIELPNQLAQYGQLAQIQNAQNQNSLAQYQLGAAQRAEAKDIARTNALSQAGTDDNAIATALLRTGDLKGYSEFLKSRRETQKFESEAKKADVDLVDAKLKQSRLFLDTINPDDPNAPAQYIAWHEANHKDPVLGPALAARGVTADQARTRISQAIQAGPQAFAELLNQSKLGAEKFIELNKPVTNAQDTGAGGRLISRPGLGGPATVVPGSEFTKTKTFGDITAEGQLNVARGRLGVEQQRLANEGQGVTYQTDANNQIVAVPTRLKPGQVPTARPVIAAGGGLQPLEGKPSEAVGKEQMSLNQQKAVLSSAIKYLDKTPSAFGFKRGMQGELVGTTLDKPEEIEARAYVYNVVSNVIKERAGTAQSTGEKETLNRFLPSEFDNASEIKAKFTAFQQYLADKETGTTKKRSTPEKPTLAPMDQEALKWANSNPADPRAAAIKQRLGM